MRTVLPRLWTSIGIVAMVFACGRATAAQSTTSAADATALAKATQNPVGDLVSLPMQFNFNSAGDLEDRTFFNLNFQPVVPFKLNDRWTVIARTIVPFVTLPVGDERSTGVGDIQQQVYFTPARPGGVIWGVGPMFSLPTATADAVRTGSWAAGPGAVVLKMTGPWVVGSLINQLWTFADTGSETETNLFTLQPFVNYNFGHGWALSFAPIMTANWDAPSGNEWTVPLGGGITKVTALGTRPMSVGFQYYYNVERPDGTAGTQIRFVLSLLYPKK